MNGPKSPFLAIFIGPIDRVSCPGPPTEPLVQAHKLGRMKAHWQSPSPWPMGLVLWSIAWTNQAHPEITHEKPWVDQDSNISRTCLKHVPTHVSTDLALDHGRARSVYKKARPFNTWNPTFQKILRPTFRTAWLPTFGKWRPKIREWLPPFLEKTNSPFPIITGIQSANRLAKIIVIN